MSIIALLAVPQAKGTLGEEQWWGQLFSLLFSHLGIRLVILIAHVLLDVQYETGSVFIHKNCLDEGIHVTVYALHI